MSAQDSVQIEVDAICGESDMAICIEVDGERVWLPLSQVDAIVRGNSPSITAKRWILEKKGLL